MVTISKSTILENIWETFYDRIVAQVTTVTTDASVVYTVQTWTSSFPDSIIDDKSAYPIIIVNPTNLNWDTHTLTKKWATGTITIDVYSVNSEACDMLLDKVINSIETYRTSAFNLGLLFVDLDSTNSDSATREGFKVHLRSATFSFKFSFTKTFP